MGRGASSEGDQQAAPSSSLASPSPSVDEAASQHLHPTGPADPYLADSSRSISKRFDEPRKRHLVESMLRVDHAGEWGAVRIYEGQLAVLRRTSMGSDLEEMTSHERA